MWQQLSNWISQFAASLRLGQAQSLYKNPGARTGRGLPGSKIYGSIITDVDWIDGGYWAAVVSSNVTAIRYGEHDPLRFEEEKEQHEYNERMGFNLGKKSKEFNPYQDMRRKATLYVAFATRNFGNTRIYRYYGVERYRAQQMFLASSMGKFVHQRLKRQYPVTGPLSPNQV